MKRAGDKPALELWEAGGLRQRGNLGSSRLVERKIRRTCSFPVIRELFPCYGQIASLLSPLFARSAIWVEDLEFNSLFPRNRALEGRGFPCSFPVTREKQESL